MRCSSGLLLGKPLIARHAKLRRHLYLAPDKALSGVAQCGYSMVTVLIYDISDYTAVHSEKTDRIAYTKTHRSIYLCIDYVSSSKASIQKTHRSIPKTHRVYKRNREPGNRARLNRKGESRIQLTQRHTSYDLPFGQFIDSVLVRGSIPSVWSGGALGLGRCIHSFATGYSTQTSPRICRGQQTDTRGGRLSLLCSLQRPSVFSEQINQIAPTAALHAWISSLAPPAPQSVVRGCAWRVLR